MPNSILEDNSRYRACKRLTDIFGGIVMLLITMFLLPFIAMAIKLDSPGPIFYKVVRIGRQGKPFHYFKFRTMVMEAATSATGPAFKLRSDPRISRVGRFLRQTSLDELPLVLNLLRGDVSLVGPRPAFPLEVQHYSEEQGRRLKVKPGITGYWQVFGREAGANDFQKMIEMDLEYVDNRSLCLDLKIVLRTVVVVLKRRAAY